MTHEAFISDPDDPRIADYVGLADAVLRGRFEDSDPVGTGSDPPIRPDWRTEHGRFVAEGLLSVVALARSPYRMRSILVADAKRHRLAEIGPKDEDLAVYIVPQPVLERTVGFTLHRGIVAVGERRPPLTPAEVVTGAGRRPLLVLEALNDHENLGVVFRSAAAFGVGGVLLDPRCADPLYRRSVRVSLGHVLAVPFARVPAAQWPSVLHDVTRAGYETVALTPGGEQTVQSCDPARWGPVALMAGAEGPGLSSESLAAATRRVRIALEPSVDSLNVGTAIAIALHWFTRVGSEEN